jgi:hypothetical protein
MRAGRHVVQGAGNPTLANALGPVEQPVVALARSEGAVDRDDLHRGSMVAGPMSDTNG